MKPLARSKRAYQPDFSKKCKQDDDKFLKSSPYTAEKTDELITDTMVHLTERLRKPERLPHLGDNAWSHDVDKKNRLRYSIEGNIIYFECHKGYYKDHSDLSLLT
jgi:Txe/YoeB family toxin of Txe-Axe toxin-antitoxin module